VLLQQELPPLLCISHCGHKLAHPLRMSTKDMIAHSGRYSGLPTRPTNLAACSCSCSCLSLVTLGRLNYHPLSLKQQARDPAAVCITFSFLQASYPFRKRCMLAHSCCVFGCKRQVLASARTRSKRLDQRRLQKMPYICVMGHKAHK
jgi:hypothetical protein